MIEWLRLWHDMPTDPKWRAIARKSSQPLPCVIALFNLLLVNASANSAARGTLSGWSNEDAAAALDMEEDDVLAIMTAMDGKVICDGALSGWERRQPKREDGTATERKAAWKARRNATERNGTQRNAPDTDTDTDTDTEKKEEPATAASSDAPPLIEKYQDIERQCREAAGLDNDPSPSLCVIGPIARLIDEGAVLERDILPVLREFAGKGRKGRSWSYYLQAIADGMKAGSGIKFSIPPPLSPETAARAASLVWIDQGSDEWEAWRSAGKRWPVKDHETTKRPGWYVPSAMPEPTRQAAE